VACFGNLGVAAQGGGSFDAPRLIASESDAKPLHDVLHSMAAIDKPERNRPARTTHSTLTKRSFFAGAGYGKCGYGKRPRGMRFRGEFQRIFACFRAISAIQKHL
jgi:hypothetical protein